MKVHYMSNSREWETPQDLFDILNEEFGFTLDVCATKKNRKCKQYFSKDGNKYSDEDGLNSSWQCLNAHSVCWMNPPYGREIGKWMKKAYMESRKRATVVCLVPARTDTNWWWDYAMKGEIRFIKGRLYFTDQHGKSGRAPFPSAIVIFKS